MHFNNENILQNSSKLTSSIWHSLGKCHLLSERQKSDFVKGGKNGLCETWKYWLGCIAALSRMSFGEKERWVHPWVIDEVSSRSVIKKDLHLGINFFERANVYSEGTSEEFIGRAIKDFSNRDEIVLATKVKFPLGKDLNNKGPNSKGLS